MIEAYLFIIVGAMAVVAAVMMLLSENAVHSALFLILNFACVAFFYLMLDAPFLAMVQIAVYAGAIMVLFLFVIMLLGAEQAEPLLKVTGGVPGSRSHIFVAAGMALLLLVLMARYVTGETVDAVEPTGTPAVRVVHGAASAPRATIELDGVVIAEEVPFGEVSRVVQVPAGEHEVRVTALVTEEQELDDGTIEEVDVEQVLFEGVIDVETPELPDTVTTVVVYDVYPEGSATNNTDPTLQLAAFLQDFSAPTGDHARVVIFNGFDQAMSLQDTGVFNRDGDSRVIVSDVQPGSFSEAVMFNEGRYRSLRLVRPVDELADDGDGEPFFTIRDHEFQNASSVLMLVTALPNAPFPNVRYAETPTFATFGSPQAVGQLLFVDYILPMQLVALVLLAALVGVIIIAQKQLSPEATTQSATRRPVRRRVSRPLTSVVANQVESDRSDTARLGAGDGAQPAGD